nr:hypothetical protein Itr_chr14CG02330 [Ipomoea trifida]
MVEFLTLFSSEPLHCMHEATVELLRPPETGGFGSGISSSATTRRQPTVFRRNPHAEGGEWEKWRPCLRCVVGVELMSYSHMPKQEGNKYL